VQINSASLPLMYPGLPTSADGVVVFSGGAGLSSATMDMVIIIEPLRQNRHNVNYAAALSLMDAANTAIKAKTLTCGIDEWAMRIEQDFIGETAYWMLVITVEASG